jgi:ABC-type multidrug transport system ATPase subunit
MPETAIRFSEVTFGFGKRKPLFENLSCSLANDSAAGKIIALMGPSGVGKTTLCDLALGIRQPQKGSVRFASGNANIAFIPQKGVIFDELSVRDNITCLKYSKSLGKSFDAQLNCRLSAQINCHATWKEEEGFLLPSSGFRI